MPKEWLDLEQFVKDQIIAQTPSNNKIFNIDSLSIMGTLFMVQATMEKLKSEAYYHSLKEAGYF